MNWWLTVTPVGFPEREDLEPCVFPATTLAEICDTLLQIEQQFAEENIKIWTIKIETDDQRQLRLLT